MTINHKLNSLKEFIYYYLQVYNNSVSIKQRLTPKEIELVCEFSTLPEKYAYYRFSIHGKRKVITSLREQNIITNVLAINLKLQSLVKKGFLLRDEDRIISLPKHLKSVIEQVARDQRFSITINYVIDNNTENIK